MIAENFAAQDLTSMPTARTWRLAVAPFWKDAVLHFTSRARRVVHGFVKAPLLPYAALFEAEMLLGMPRKREYFEPDPFATEASSQDDTWPRL